MATRLLPTCLTLVLAGVFLLAGASKAWRPGEFIDVARFLAPEGWRSTGVLLAATIGLAMIETAIGAALLVLGPIRPVLTVACVAIAGFSAALLVLVLSPNAPACGCLSLVRLDHARDDAAAGLARNGGMLWMAAWLLAVPRGQPRASTPPLARRANGFTLIELLIVIAIIGLLLALALPSMATARVAAKNSERTSTVRQLVLSLSVYTSDHREAFPFFGVPGNPFEPIVVHGFKIEGAFFQTQRWYWASAIVPDYFSPRAAIEPPSRAAYLREVRGYPEGVVAAYYQLSSTVFAHPNFWSDDSDDEDAWYDVRYFNRTRQSDVLFPSLKGLLAADVAGPGGNPSWVRPGVPFPTAMADGSARTVHRRDLDPSRCVARPFNAGGIPIFSTRDGLAGRDF